MEMFKITFSNSVYHNNYYVVVSSLDEALGMAQAAEQKHGAHNSGFSSIEVVGVIGPDEDENLLLSDEALVLLRGE